MEIIKNKKPIYLLILFVVLILCIGVVYFIVEIVKEGDSESTVQIDDVITPAGEAINNLTVQDGVREEDQRNIDDVITPAGEAINN